MTKPTRKGLTLAKTKLMVRRSRGKREDLRHREAHERRSRGRTRRGERVRGRRQEELADVARFAYLASF